MTVPSSLNSPELSAVWQRVRGRLEVRGADNRGRLVLPPLSSSAKLVLKALIGQPPGKTVELAVLERGLVHLGVGSDLASALAAVGYAVSAEPARRRAERVEREEGRRMARVAVAGWQEPWAQDWIDDVIRAGILRGFGRAEAEALLRQVRAVLDRLEQDRPVPMSRVDLAAQVLGSAHALDTGTRVEAAVARALAFKIGPVGHRDLWTQAGVHLDLTSAPALTWRLPLTEDCALAPLATAALQAGIPLHLSRLALEAYPVVVPQSSRILVVENPRVVEAAVQARALQSVVSTNGQPSSTVLLLLSQLLAAGGELLYHGDFDAAGLAICERLMRVGVTPWRMNAADYRAALMAADADGAVLPIDTHAPGVTSWDPTLQHVFDHERRIVHEERLLSLLISDGFTHG